MKIGEQRQILKELNKEARTRAARLTKHGYTGEMTTPAIRDYQRTPADELIRAIQDLQIYVRDPRSKVSGMKRINEQTLSTLHDNGYDFVDESNLADFGRFMNMVREIHGAKGFPSDEVARMFKRAERLGISRNVIKTKFAEYLTDINGITDLNLTLEQMALPEDRKRISSTEVFDKMDELGLL